MVKINADKSKRWGFTIVEIMIVIAIIAVLAVIVVPQVTRARISSNQASAKATLRVIGTALDSYLADNQIYPADTATLISALPAYLQKDYFNGVHAGYVFTATLSDYQYTITATPDSASTGQKTFTLSTGARLTETE